MDPSLLHPALTGDGWGGSAGGRGSNGEEPPSKALPFSAHAQAVLREGGGAAAGAEGEGAWGMRGTRVQRARGMGYPEDASAQDSTGRTGGRREGRTRGPRRLKGCQARLLNPRFSPRFPAAPRPRARAHGHSPQHSPRAEGRQPSSRTSCLITKRPSPGRDGSLGWTHGDVCFCSLLCSFIPFFIKLQTWRLAKRPPLPTPAPCWLGTLALHGHPAPPAPHHQVLTVDEVLFFRGVDAGQVAGPAAAISLGILPRPPVCEITVAVALELVPTPVTALRVWERTHIGDRQGPPSSSASTWAKGSPKPLR